MIFKCIVSFSTMVTFVIEHCKTLGTKFKMADFCGIDTRLVNFELKTLCFLDFLDRILISNYSYLSKEESSARKLQSGNAPQAPQSGEKTRAVWP